MKLRQRLHKSPLIQIFRQVFLVFSYGSSPPDFQNKMSKGKWRSEGVMEWIRPTTTTWKIINIFHVKKGPSKLVTTTFCLKLSSVKCFTQTCECFEGMKHRLFIFIKPFSFLFWFRVVFLWRSPLTWNQKGFKFPALLELASDITSFISFPLVAVGISPPFFVYYLLILTDPGLQRSGTILH